MIIETQGDITKASEMVMAHQVNCQSVMGSGVAGAIRREFPQHYIDFMNDKRTPEEKLGTVIRTHTKNKFIFGLYGQLECGYDGKEYTSYVGLGNAITEMMLWCKHYGVKVVNMPKYMGCALGGGDWKIVQVMLEHLSEDFGVHINLRYL
jgi:O-acetyl-ADP-ribose deacetylase (regulator of RNase III)